MRAISIAGVIVALISIAEAQPIEIATHEPIALVVVVDRSRPMRGDKLDAVKHAVVEILDTLDPGDQIAVVGYGRTAKVVVPLQPVRNRKQIVAQIRRLRAGDGANVVAGLEAASAVLESSATERKRVLVITCGDALLGVRRAAGSLRGSGVSVSAIGLESVSRATVTEIATAGAGRALMVDDLTKLPSIVVAETTVPSVFDPGAVVFVIDRSGSMQGEKLEAVKEAVRAAVDVLDRNDSVAVVTFDTEAQVVVPLQRAANRMRIAADVSQITAGGGTNVYAGLKAAQGVLAAANVPIKHVIVLTDGESPYDGIAELVADMAASRTTISAVGVTGADRNLLSIIAGNGRLYMVEDLATLPKLFMREVQPLSQP